MIGAHHVEHRPLKPKSLRDRLRAAPPKILGCAGGDVENVIATKTVSAGKMVSTAPVYNISSANINNGIAPRSNQPQPMKFSSLATASAARKPLATIALAPAGVVGSGAGAMPSSIHHQKTTDPTIAKPPTATAFMSSVFASFSSDFVTSSSSAVLSSSALSTGPTPSNAPALADSALSLDDLPSFCLDNELESSQVQPRRLQRRKSRLSVRGTRAGSPPLDTSTGPENTTRAHIPAIFPFKTQDTYDDTLLELPSPLHANGPAAVPSMDTISSEAFEANSDAPLQLHDLEDKITKDVIGMADDAFFTSMDSDMPAMSVDDVSAGPTTRRKSTAAFRDNTAILNTIAPTHDEKSISTPNAKAVCPRAPRSRVERTVGMASSYLKASKVTFSEDTYRQTHAVTPIPPQQQQQQHQVEDTPHVAKAPLSEVEAAWLSEALPFAQRAREQWRRVADPLVHMGSRRLRHSVDRAQGHTAGVVAAVLSLFYGVEGVEESGQGGRDAVDASCLAPFFSMLSTLTEAESVVCNNILAINRSNVAFNDAANHSVAAKNKKKEMETASESFARLPCASAAVLRGPVTPQRDLPGDNKSRGRAKLKLKTVRFATANFAAVEPAPTDISAVFVEEMQPDEYREQGVYRSNGGIDNGVLAVLLSKVCLKGKVLKQKIGDDTASKALVEAFLLGIEAFVRCKTVDTWNELRYQCEDASDLIDSLGHGWCDTICAGRQMGEELQALFNTDPLCLPYKRSLSNCVSSAMRFHLRQAFNSHIYDKHFETRAPSAKAREGAIGDHHSRLSSSSVTDVALHKRLLARTVKCGGVGKGGGAIECGYITMHPAGSSGYNENDLAAVVHTALSQLHFHRQAVLDLITPHTLCDMNTDVPTPRDNFSMLATRRLTVMQLIDKASIRGLISATHFINAHAFLRSLLQMEEVWAAISGGGSAWRNLRMFARIADSCDCESEAYLFALKDLPALAVQLNEEADGVEKIASCVRNTFERHSKAFAVDLERRKRSRENSQSDRADVEEEAPAATGRPKKRTRRQSRLAEVEDTATHSPPEPANLLDRMTVSLDRTRLAFGSPSPAGKVRRGMKAPQASPGMSPLAQTFGGMFLSEDVSASKRFFSDASPVAFSQYEAEQQKPTRAEQLTDLEELEELINTFKMPGLRVTRCSGDYRMDLPDGASVILPAEEPAGNFMSHSETLSAVFTATGSFHAATTQVGTMRAAPVPAARHRDRNISTLSLSVEVDSVTEPAAAVKAVETGFSPCRLFSAFESATGFAPSLAQSKQVCGDCKRAITAHELAAGHGRAVQKCCSCKDLYHIRCLGLPENFADFEDTEAYRCPNCFS